MTILDTYFFMFEADTSKVQKGIDAGGKGADDLTKKLNTTDVVAGKLGDSFTKAVKSAGVLVGVIGTLAVIKTLTSNTADHTFAVSQQAKAMGVSVETLSTWQHAVVAAGGTAEGATTTIGNLREKFVEMSRYGAMIGPDAFMFKQLGLSAQEMRDSIKDPNIALGKLSETFGKLNKTQQLFIGKKLGFDQGTIAILSQGREKFDEIIAKQKELGVVTEAQAAAATKYKLAQMELGVVLETIKRETTTALLPAFTWTIERVEKLITWLRNNKAFAIGFFGGMAAMITVAVLPALLAATGGMWAFLAPILAIVLPILAIGAAFGLVADDVHAFLTGQQSVIGEISKKWPIVGDIVKGVAAVIKEAFAIITLAFADPMAALTRLQVAIEKLFITLGKWQLTKLASLADKIGLHGVAKSLNDMVAAATPQAVAKTLAEVAAPTGSVSVVKGGLTTDVLSAAQSAEKKYGVPAQVTLAQWALESGSGKHMPADSNNPFGIKARAGQPFVEAMTTEHVNGQDVRVMQKFAKYESLVDAFEAHAKLLATGSAYSAARKTSDPGAYADALTGKYATDPNYGAKLKSIMATQAKAIRDAQQDQLSATVSTGQNALAQTNVPIASQSSQMISNSRTSNRSSSITMGNVDIHTQSTDPVGIRDVFKNSLQGQLSNALEQHDDGVSS